MGYKLYINFITNIMTIFYKYLFKQLLVSQNH